MVCIDVVAAGALGQHDARGVVRRDVAVAILGQVFRQVTDGHRQVRVPAIQLLELAQDGAGVEALLEQEHRLGQGLSPGNHRADVGRFRNVLELGLLDLLAEVDVLKVSKVILIREH